ncbi:hypothetical protein, partial [Mobiluncus mulieris]|uniref:hypothetical protein n=1 Tax=Mobiluncus mulieris TaxID=2052 RepID=UPI0021E33EB6
RTNLGSETLMSRLGDCQCFPHCVELSRGKCPLEIPAKNLYRVAVASGIFNGSVVNNRLYSG